MLTSCKKIRDLLKDNLPINRVRKFYIGDITMVPQSVLPCITISPVKTDINVIDNQRDAFTQSIDIALIIDVKKDLSSDLSITTGTEFLLKTMEEEDGAGQLKTDTILYILRHNIHIEDNRQITNVSSVDYPTPPRSRPEQETTLEAVVHIDVQKIFDR